MSRLAFVGSAALAMSLALVLPACKPSATKTPVVRDAQGKPVVLPEPLEVALSSPEVVHLDRPGMWIGRVTTWLPEPKSATALLESELMSLMPRDLAGVVAAAAELDEPWTIVRAQQGEELWRIPVRKDARAALSERLASLTAEGNFGGRVLGPPAVESRDGRQGIPRNQGEARPILIWLDPREGTIVLASSVAGLVSGPNIAATFAEQGVIARAGTERLAGRSPLRRVEIQGSQETLRVSVEVDPKAAGDELPNLRKELRMDPSPMLEAIAYGELAVAVSSRFSDAPQVVKQAIAQGRRAADNAPFFVKGIVKDMSDKFAAAAKSWDGRYVLAIGPGRHAFVAYGATNPKDSGKAVIRLLDTAAANITMGSKFLDNLPSISVRKNVVKGSREPIHLLTLGKVKRYVPAEFQPLLTEERQLKIAMAFSEAAGGGMVVIGSAPDAALAKWLESLPDVESAKATRASTRESLAAAVIAVSPTQLQALDGSLNLSRALDLKADPAARVDVNVTQYSVTSLDAVLKFATPPQKPGRARR